MKEGWNLRRHGFGAAAIAAAGLVLGLQWLAIDRQSLIGDAPYHLLAGEQALRSGQNQLNLEHPPLVKLVAAWPLLDEEPLSPPVAMDRAIATSLRIFDDPARTRRAQRQARTVLLLVFGLPFLAGCYVLGQWWGGPRAGGVLALALGLSFSVLPYLSVIQTDTAVAMGFVWTLVACLIYLERPGSPRAVAVGLGLGLTLAAKYSGLLILPSVALAVLLAARRSARPLRQLLISSVLIGSVSLAGLYGSYAIANRSYDPAIGSDTLERYLDGQGMITGNTLQRHGDLLLAAERIDPNLAQWLTGLLGIRAQNARGVYPSYAFGHLSSEGRWWYFPAQLLVRTPLAILLATVAGLVLLLRRKRDAARSRTSLPATARWHGPALVAVTAAAYLAVAMRSNYNLGFRHLLPVLPILYLPAALWAARHRRRCAVLITLLAVEAMAVAPLWMGSTNTWWLGASNPSRAAFGSLEYHQNFLTLAREAERRELDDLSVLYPLLPAEELGAYLPEARLLTPESALRPGSWVAVNLLVEQIFPAIDRTPPETLHGHRHLASLVRQWTPLWQRIRQGEDHGEIAGTFYLYRVETDMDATP